MRYRKKNIDEVFKDKNWEGVKRFVDKFGLPLLILLDRIVKTKDMEGLKDFIQRYGIEPVVEYGMPVGGEGVKELYALSDRYHSHKQKTGAEWWVRDEVADAIDQLRGYSADPSFLDRVALAWKDVDAQIEAPPEVKAGAFKKVLITSMVKGIYSPVFHEERHIMERITTLFEKIHFTADMKYNDHFAD